ncbi:MAG: spore germination lipoprotein GerD [Bacillus sp. (in: firmicutes)]
MKLKTVFLTLATLCALVACSPKEEATDKTDYEETKKMVIDILKTDEGKKAIQKILSDDELKSQLIMEQDAVTSAIEKNLTSEKGKKFWEEAFKDPKFTASYAKALEDEHKKVLKDLLSDPTYLGKIMEIWKDPEMEKELTKIIKSKKVRDELKETTLETIDSPLVQAKIQEILLKAAKELPAETKKEENKGGASQTQTGSGGGGGGQGGPGQGSGGSGQ